MSKLYYTKIETYRDSCKTYALKRVGLSNLLGKNEPSIKELITHKYFEVVKIPVVGSILIWQNLPELSKPYFIAQTIDEKGNLISTERTDYGHCAVFERNNLISDCTWEPEWGSLLRLRKYSDLQEPDFILKIKHKP